MEKQGSKLRKFTIKQLQKGVKGVIIQKKGGNVVAVFGWLLLIWVIGVCPPLGVIIGILALIWVALTETK